MAETKTETRERERMEQRMERATEQAFQTIEDTWSNIMDNNRKSLYTMMAYNRDAINTSYEYARHLQEESLRLADAWMDNLTTFQREYIKTVQQYTGRLQDYTQKTVTEGQNRIEETLDQSMELVSPVMASRGKRR